MAATIRSLDEFINESTGLYKDNTAGDISASDLRDGVASWYRPQATCMGRLTTESGVPASPSDRTAQSTIYFTPTNGNLVGLFDGTSWTLRVFSEVSLALSGLTSGANYDVFLYNNSGTLTLELSAAWASDTTRTDALTQQDGVYVKGGATTRRYLGTIRTTSTSTTEDSKSKRFVWNCYNQIPRSIMKLETNGFWTYTTATWRQARASAANQVEIVAGIQCGMLDLNCIACSQQTGSIYRAAGIGENRTTDTDADILNSSDRPGLAGHSAHLKKVPNLGYAYYAWVEYSNTTGTTTWYGTATTPTNGSCGLTGFITC